MNSIVDWATSHARMILVFVVLSLSAGGFAYVGLPKEGAPDIDIPVLHVSVPYPGVSAVDSESLLVQPLETAFEELEGVKSINATASEGYAGVTLEFEFGWDKDAVLAEVREQASQAAAEFPSGAEQHKIHEINFSEFPIIVVALSGDVPERTLTRIARETQTELESLPAVLEANLTGHRDEAVEVLIDPLKLESLDMTPQEIIQAILQNNRPIAAGNIETAAGAFAVKIPSSFDDPSDISNLIVTANGDSVVTLGDLADIRLTFEDRNGVARYNGKPSVVLQIVKRKGFNHLETVQAVRETVAEVADLWPQEVKESVRVDFGLDQSEAVGSMIRQLESSVLTAVLMVMIVVLATLGMRSALLVGFAIPTSFLLGFAVMGIAGVVISNIVMFGLILAVGMLVDGAIVVVEYADKCIRAGTGPMRAYAQAAKRMAWPIISSTATTLCAFLPMLFWPGVPGELMGNLPVTLIFVLSASLLVALVYLPVVGGVTARLSRLQATAAERLRSGTHWALRAFLLALSLSVLFGGALLILRGNLPAIALFTAAALALPVTGNAVFGRKASPPPGFGYRRSWFGNIVRAIVCNPVMPFVTIAAIAGVVFYVFDYYAEHNLGVEFFATTEPENAIVYVRARGNHSIAEKDTLIRAVEDQLSGIDGIRSVFAFTGSGSLSVAGTAPNTPVDMIGQIQIELDRWEVRGTGTGDGIIAEVRRRAASVPGIKTEVVVQERGPSDGKPVNLRISGQNWEHLLELTETVSSRFAETDGLVDIDDTRPLPGIDWKIEVDVERAGRYGADVTILGSLVQMVTSGLKIDTMRVENSEDEIDITVRLPQESRLLSTLDGLRVRTKEGLIPLSNFVTREPVRKLAQINRVDGRRAFNVRADVAEGRNVNEAIGELTKWLEEEAEFPPGVSWSWQGDQQEQQESAEFLGYAFIGALGLMFVILLAQFNSLYNSVLVLLAVVLATTGVLIGMLVMNQPFSVIMTGTGIVALAGIVVNNNIVLIDTYSEFSRRMPALQAIVRTAEARLRPVALTTLTTMVGLTPLMLGISIDFAKGGYTVNAPASLWWKQLATAVVFGLGTSTVLTLVLTPSLLAVRCWVATGRHRLVQAVRSRVEGPEGSAAGDIRLLRWARQWAGPTEIVWTDGISFARDDEAIRSKPRLVEDGEPKTEPDMSITEKPPLRVAS